MPNTPAGPAGSFGPGQGSSGVFDFDAMDAEDDRRRKTFRGAGTGKGGGLGAGVNRASPFAGPPPGMSTGSGLPRGSNGTPFMAPPQMPQMPQPTPQFVGGLDPTFMDQMKYFFWIATGAVSNIGISTCRWT